MRVLVACEFSGIVRDAFAALGHDAWSCDLLPTESPGNHYQMDILHLLDLNHFWDLIIAHPVCTKMCVSGNRTYAGTQARIDAINWTINFWNKLKQKTKRGCLENPVSVLWQHIGKPQYIQPWMFGHPETKKTGLLLHNLPPLVPTNNVHDQMMKLSKKERTRIHYMSPGPDRGKERSRFYHGIASAMADQWGALS